MLKLTRDDQVQYAEGVVADYLQAQGWKAEELPEPAEEELADNSPTPPEPDHTADENILVEQPKETVEQPKETPKRKAK